MADAQGAADLIPSRVAAQLLQRAARRAPADVVRHLLAVQAQDFASFPLALRARASGLTLADVQGGLDDGDIVVSWLNRGTLHLVCREDYWWLHALTAPTSRTANRRRLAEEGVTRVERGVELIERALADGPLLRREIGESLARGGVKAARGGLTHLLMAASLDGSIVRGPVRGREQTFALAHDHVGERVALERDDALAELARRYLSGHAPATAADLAYWSGLPLRDVRRGIELAGVDPGRGPRPPRKLPPRLLPAFDPYIMGWKDRSFAIAQQHTRRVVPGGGMFRAVVLIDGKVAGTWSRAGGRVTVDPLDPLPPLDREIADVERFLS